MKYNDPNQHMFYSIAGMLVSILNKDTPTHDKILIKLKTALELMQDENERFRVEIEQALYDTLALFSSNVVFDDLRSLIEILYEDVCSYNRGNIHAKHAIESRILDIAYLHGYVRRGLLHKKCPKPLMDIHFDVADHQEKKNASPHVTPLNIFEDPYDDRIGI